MQIIQCQNVVFHETELATGIPKAYRPLHNFRLTAVFFVDSSSSVAVSVAGIGDNDLPLFAISRIHKHLRSTSS